HIPDIPIAIWAARRGMPIQAPLPLARFRAGHDLAVFVPVEDALHRDEQAVLVGMIALTATPGVPQPDAVCLTARGKLQPVPCFAADAVKSIGNDVTHAAGFN